MTRAGWQTVEHWQVHTSLGVWELYLLQVDDIFSKAWRVEWCWRGHQRKGESFGGDGREVRARQELDRRKARYVDAEWQLVG